MVYTNSLTTVYDYATIKSESDCSVSTSFRIKVPGSFSGVTGMHHISGLYSQSFSVLKPVVKEGLV